MPTRKPRRQRLFVVAALVERRGRVLLSQRRADQTFALHWEFPGGKVEPGEDPREALARELLEELGCVVRAGDVVELVFHPYPTFDLVMPVYRAKILRGRPRATQVAAVQWVPRAQLPSMKMPPADVPLAQRLADGIAARAPAGARSVTRQRPTGSPNRRPTGRPR